MDFEVPENEDNGDQTVADLGLRPAPPPNLSINDIPAILRKQHHRIPIRYHDTLPASLESLPETSVSSNGEAEHGGVQDGVFQTAPNIFGLFRRYRHCPSYDPDGEVTLEELAGFAMSKAEVDSPPSQDDLPSLYGPSTREAFHPFPNMSTFMLSDWYYNSPSGERSGPDFNRLISMLSDERFNCADIIGFNASVRDKLLDQANNLGVNEDMEQTAIGGWRCNVPVKVQIPEGKQHWTNNEGCTYTVPGLHHRSITEIIQSVFETNTHLHFTPFELWWQPDPNILPQRIYSDISSSQAFHDAHDEINQSPNFQVPGCKLEKTVAAIMIYSDSTHLAQFGTAKLWPIYGFTGNLDKWFRLKPSTHSCEHWAYIPSVSNFSSTILPPFIGL
jgi:hypothetical protein